MLIVHVGLDILYIYIYMQPLTHIWDQGKNYYGYILCLKA